jgi:hypothetical protein
VEKEGNKGRALEAKESRKGGQKERSFGTMKKREKGERTARGPNRDCMNCSASTAEKKTVIFLWSEKTVSHTLELH